MRILHTESSLNWGGQEYRILEQIEWLKKNGHQSWLAAPEGSEIQKKAKEQGIEVLNLPFSSTLDVKSIRRIREFVRCYGIDIIDAHGNKDADAAGFCQNLCGVVRSLHVYRPLKTTWIRKARWLFLNHRVIATAEIIRQQVASLGYKPLEKIDVVGEWAADPFFVQAGNREKNKETLCRELHIDLKKPVYGIVGMLRKDKGQMHFLEIAATCQAKGIEGFFLVVGEATDNQKAYKTSLLRFVQENALQDRVRFLGYRSDVPEIMSALDAVLLCSNNVEAQSRVVPQSFAVGTPVIASRVGGVPELVTDRKSGILVDIGDVSGYVSALEVLQKDPETARKMVKAARTFAARNLTLAHRMEETMAIYRKVLKGKSEPQAFS